MEIDDKIKNRLSKKAEKPRYLHSPGHVLADELSRKFNEPKRFGFYLKMAQKYDHGMLRKIAAEVFEAKPKKPGALFTYLLNKANNDK